MIEGHVSYKTILAKLYRDLDINSEINEISVIEWINEALLMIGAYSQFTEISECLTLKNGKAKLPCGFYKLVDINYQNKPVYWSSNQNRSNYQCHNCRIPTFLDNKEDYTFYINDSYMITNINDDSNKEANICIVYLGIPTDEDGYPLIPDDIYYSKALAAYVTSMLDYQEWRKGKIADKVYQKSEQDWLFYVNSARGAANMPNKAQLEALKNVMLRLASIPNEYSRNFKNFDKPEKLNL